MPESIWKKPKDTDEAVADLLRLVDDLCKLLDTMTLADVYKRHAGTLKMKGRIIKVGLLQQIKSGKIKPESDIYGYFGLKKMTGKDSEIFNLQDFNIMKFLNL